MTQFKSLQKHSCDIINNRSLIFGYIVVIETKPILEINVGANLMFALRTKTVIKPMFENVLETFAFGHRFANDCCQEGEHKVRPYIDF